MDVLLHALGAHHTAGLTATIDLKDVGAVIEVDLGVVVPCVGTVAGAIDGTRGHAVLIMALLDGDVNIDDAIDGAAHIVVATVDGTQHERIAQRHIVLYAGTVVHQYGIGTVVLHMGLDDIARLVDVLTVCTAEDAANIDGGACGNVDHRAACDTLGEAAAIGGADVAAHQVDDGGGLVEVETVGTGLLVGVVHANTAPGTGTEYLHIGVFVEVLWIVIADLRNVNQHIAAVLH